MSAWVLGLTGGIGSGKSAVSDMLAARGASVVDTDEIARALTRSGGAGMAGIRACFGDAVVAADGALDRAAMRQRVFADPKARAQLENILHPMIRDQAAQAVKAASGQYVVLAVPLLVESAHWQERCDRIAVVDCPESVQIARVMQRSGLSADEVRAIMATQATRAERRAAADDVIDNGGSFDSLREQVESLHLRCLAAARIKSGGAVL